MKVWLTLLLSIIMSLNLNAQSVDLEELHSIAQSYLKSDNLKSAIDAYEQLYNQAIDAKHDSLRKEASFNIYNSNFRLGKLYNSISHLESELEYVKSHQPNDGDYLAKVYNRLGYLLSSTGDIIGSNLCYAQTGAIKKNDIKYYHTYVSQALSTNYARLGDYNAAIDIQQQAVEMFTDSLFLNGLAEGLNNLGEFHLIMDQMKLAEDQFRQVLNSQYKFRKLDLATANNGLSQIYLFKSFLDSALICNLKAQQLNKEFKATSQDEYDDQQDLKLGILVTNADLYRAKDKFKNALTEINQALELCRDQFSNNKRGLAKLHIQKGSILLELGELAEARLNYAHSLELLSGYTTDTQNLPAYQGLCRVDLHELKAEFSIDLANSILDNVYNSLNYYLSIRGHYKYDDSIFNLTDYVKDLSSIGIETCYQAYVETQDQKLLQSALELMENTKASALYKAIIKLNQNQESDSITLKKRYLNEFIISKTRLLNDSTLSSEKRKRIEKNLKEWKFELSSLPADQLEAYNELSRFEFFSAVLNRENSTAIIYHWDFTSKVIYAIYSQNGILGIKKIADYESLLENLASYQSLFKFSNRHNFKRDLAKNVYQTLIPSELKEYSNLIIIPDGELSLIPFEALINEQGDYLIQESTITYSNSLSILALQSNQKSDQNNKVLALAPIFKDSNDLFLAKSQEEIDGILDLVQGSKFLSKDAVSQVLSESAKDFSVLHLSTHAGVESSESSAYIEFYDRRMNLEEIYALTLNNKLAVLSACETGLGENVNSEGVLSLSRAFSYAGVNSVVSSRWKINENSTKQIFSEFYKNLFDDQTISTSLANAQRAYLSNPSVSKEAKSPYYWAGYVHWGSDKSIELRSKWCSNQLTVLFFLIGLIVLVAILKLKVISRP